MHDFWEWIRCVFSEETSFEFFLPYGPMLTKTKKKNVKNKKIENFWKTTNMVWRYGGYVGYMALKFGVNPLDGFRGNDVYGRTTDERTTDAAHVMTVGLLCSNTKQS